MDPETMQVPSVLIKYLDSCNSRDQSCKRLEIISWVLGLFLALFIVLAYFHIKSMGTTPASVVKTLSNEVPISVGFESSPNVETPVPVKQPPNFTQGDYVGCYEKNSPDAQDQVIFDESELLDVAIVNQKIKEFETVSGDDYTPNDSAYSHEKFIVNDSLGSDVPESHRKWAKEVQSGNLSMTTLQMQFDPEEALQAQGIRQYRKVPKGHGAIATAMSLFDSNEDGNGLAGNASREIKSL